jgi:hypothetical protein
VERVANGEPLRVVEGVPSADPETVSVAEGVVKGDPDPDPVCGWEGLEEGVMEPVKEGVAKGLCVCVSEEEVVPDLDLVGLGVWSAEPDGLSVPVPVMEGLKVLEELVEAVTVGLAVFAALDVRVCVNVCVFVDV